MRSVPALAVALLIGSLCLVACGNGGTATPSPSGRATIGPTPRQRDFPVTTTPTASQPAAVGEVPQQMLDLILDDAANRSGVSRAELDVERAEATTWSDGSLGCPVPGRLYTQMVIDGYWVVVAGGGQTLDYRVGSGGRFRLCEASPPGRGGRVR